MLFRVSNKTYTSLNLNMSVCKWEVLEEIFDGELNSREIAERFGVSIEAAQNRLRRAHKAGWLNRRKFEGVFYYSLSEKAWDFYDQHGSFIDHPWYG